MNYLLAFISVFVAVDAIGVVPIFISLTQEIKERERKKIIHQSVSTAFCVAVSFILVGKLVFHLLGIKVEDFMIAGGTILFILATSDLLFPTKRYRTPSPGVVPLGMPLIVGPAVMTTSLIALDAYGLFPTLFAVVTNLIIVGFVLSSSQWVIKLLGKGGSQAISKVASLLLASIGIMMVRRGIAGLLTSL